MTLPMFLNGNGKAERRGNGSAQKLANECRPSNAVMRCDRPVQQRMRGTDRFITVGCKQCWPCVQSKKNDKTGRLLAEAMGAVRVDMWTPTYGNKTAHSRYGSKVRQAEDAQKFMKAYRERERRGLRAYNRLERKLALSEGRQPRLVDVSRTYLKFEVVSELGSKFQRAHFHILVFHLPHFPVRRSALIQGKSAVRPEGLERVWDLPFEAGPIPRRLPEGANDPELLDFRVTGSQVHNLWPNGFINVECASHDMSAVDVWGLSRPKEKPMTAVMQHVQYLFKYMDKAVTARWFGRTRKLTAEQLEEQKDRDQRGRGGRTVHRLGSRGIGCEFALAFAEAHANAGVPLHNLHFTVPGITIKRNVNLMVDVDEKMQRRRVPDEIRFGALRDMEKLVFQMQGGMFTSCVDHYMAIMEGKGAGDIRRMGPVAAKRKRALEVRSMNDRIRTEGEFVRGHCYGMGYLTRQWLLETKRTAGELAASVADYILREDWLPEFVWPVEPVRGYRQTEEHVTRRKLEHQGFEFKDEFEKLDEVRECAAMVEEFWRRLGLHRGRVLKTKKAFSLQKELVFGPRGAPEIVLGPRADEPMQRRAEEVFERAERKYREKCDEFEGRDFDDEALRRLFEDYRIAADNVLVERSPVLVPPEGAVRCGLIGHERAMRWLNFSHAYEFPRRREELIERYCIVRFLAPDRRLLITPDGRVLYQEKKRSERKRRVEREIINAALTFKECSNRQGPKRLRCGNCYDCLTPIQGNAERHNFEEWVECEKWASVHVQSREELDLVFAGLLETPLADGMQPEVFNSSLPRPFFKAWGSEVCPVRERVLALSSEFENSALFVSKQKKSYPALSSPAVAG